MEITENNHQADKMQMQQCEVNGLNKTKETFEGFAEITENERGTLTRTNSENIIRNTQSRRDITRYE